MIEIIYNHPEFEYDVYGLVQALFPHEELETVYDVPPEERDRLPYQSRHRLVGETTEKDEKQPDGRSDSREASLRVNYLPGQIQLIYQEKGKPSQEISAKLPEEWPENPARDKVTRPEMKNILKRLVYKLLSQVTGKTLPWGTLTGIRPTKVPLRMLEEGASDDEIRQYMKDAYETSDEKIATATEIAHTEHHILHSMDLEKGYSIYIGIPFCPTTCLYCSFPSYARASFEGQVDRYLDALEREIRAVGARMAELDRTLDTVYIGGGTPTALTHLELERLFKVLEDALPMDGIREFTVEAGRPDSITREKLEVMKAHAVSRISINPQTMQDKTLKLIGRHHTSEQLRDAFRMAREEGFHDINMDLILGLPGETTSDVQETLDQVVLMGPDNLTIHSLAIKAKSRLNHEWEAYQDYAMENSDALMQMAHKAAADLGLHPYYLYRQKNMIGNLENVGFSRPGLEGLYNILIMEEKETILALGAGTSSKYVSAGGKKVDRTENVKDVTTYIERIEEMIDRKMQKLQLQLQ